MKLKEVAMFNKILGIVFVIISMQAAFANDTFQGSIGPIPKTLQKTMIEKTWNTGCPVALDDLSYLKLSYWGFDNKPHVGEMIINEKLAPEVIDIFKKLYENHFPIEKMVIPEELAKDKKFKTPMDFLLYIVNANDTYGFFCRIDTQTNNKSSPHSFGIAIDINPYYNPGVIKYAKTNSALHATQQAGYKYLNRNLVHIGMIKENDKAFQIFTNHGWKWGGFFDTGVDYMHFQKTMSPYYIVNHLEYISPKQRIKNLPD